MAKVQGPNEATKQELHFLKYLGEWCPEGHPVRAHGRFALLVAYEQAAFSRARWDGIDKQLVLASLDDMQRKATA